MYCWSLCAESPASLPITFGHFLAEPPPPSLLVTFRHTQPPYPKRDIIYGQPLMSYELCVVLASFELETQLKFQGCTRTGASRARVRSRARDLRLDFYKAGYSGEPPVKT